MMSKNLQNFIATLIFTLVFSFIMPWWSILVAALITGILIPLKKAAVFLIPFLAIFLYWSVYCFVLSNANDFILAKKISALLMLGGNPYVLILVTGFIGGIAAGLNGVLGKQIVTVFPRLAKKSKD